MKKNQKNLACDWIALSKKIGTTTVSFLIEAKKLNWELFSIWKQTKNTYGVLFSGTNCAWFCFIYCISLFQIGNFVCDQFLTFESNRERDTNVKTTFLRFFSFEMVQHELFFCFVFASVFLFYLKCMTARFRDSGDQLMWRGDLGLAHTSAEKVNRGERGS